MVKTLIPGQGTKILNAAQQGQQKKREKKFIHSVKNIKNIFNVLDSIHMEIREVF